MPFTGSLKENQTDVQIIKDAPLPELLPSMGRQLRSSVGSPQSRMEATVVGTKPATWNVYIDAILADGNYWNTGNQPTTINYSFWGEGSENFDNPYGDIARQAYNWTTEEKEVVNQALATWSNVANIKFQNVGDNNESSTLGLYKLDQTKFISDSVIDIGRGFFSTPNSSLPQGFGYFNKDGDEWNTKGLKQGAKGFITLIHELGHGLGLAHPFGDPRRSAPVFPGIDYGKAQQIGTYGLNQGVYTTMSYNAGLTKSGLDPITYQYGYQGTPMAFDIAAIQYLYGANINYQSGDNTYSLPTVNTPGTFYSCIWDTGGIDTITADGAKSGAEINLNDATINVAHQSGAGGYISSVQNIYGGFTIANNVTIENATGSPHNDTLTGNEADNKLQGKEGNDRLLGGAGNDQLAGGEGSDVFLYDTNIPFTTESLGGVGVDTITDFNTSQGDKIVLDQTTFTTISSLAGNGFSIADEFVSVTSNLDTWSADIIYNPTTGELFYNENGTAPGYGDGGKFLVLSNNPVLSASDFIIQT